MLNVESFVIPRTILKVLEIEEVIRVIIEEKTHVDYVVLVHALENFQLLLDLKDPLLGLGLFLLVGNLQFGQNSKKTAFVVEAPVLLEDFVDRVSLYLFALAHQKNHFQGSLEKALTSEKAQTVDLHSVDVSFPFPMV